jgi:hypothetical protein
MKLIKFIAAAALVASTSLISGGNDALSHTQAVAGVCPNWPYCRDVDFSDQTLDVQQHMTIEAIRKAV